MRAKRFDESQPYAEIWGAGGLWGYEQDGVTYNPDGSPMGEPASAEADEGTDPEEPQSETEPEPMERLTYAELSRKSNSELQTMVELAGGTWTTRSRAITYLQNMQ